MKKIAILTIAALLVLFAAGCGNTGGTANGSTTVSNESNIDSVDTGETESSETPEKFQIIVADAKTTHHLNLYVAQELGYFEELGLEVVIESVEDNAAARDLVVSGGADVFWSCPTVAIAAVANGAPIKAIAQVKAPCTSVLVVDENSDIKQLTDLENKSIAGISPTCEAVISITAAAKQAGSEFVLEKLAGGPAIQALASGAVDAAILEEPHVSIAELEGYKVLFPDISANIPCRTINATNSLLASNPDALKLFIEAVDRANNKILANPVADDIVDIAVEYTGAPADAIRHGNDRLKFDVQLKVDGLKELGEALKEGGNITENPGDNIFADEFKGLTW